MDWGKYEWIKHLPKTALEEMVGYLQTFGEVKPNTKEDKKRQKTALAAANFLPNPLTPGIIAEEGRRNKLSRRMAEIDREARQ